MVKLTEQEIALLRTQLAAKETSLRAALDVADRPAELRTPGDERELAEAAILQARDDAMLGHYRMELADIAAARLRMQCGEYGVCIDCQQPIPFLRMQAYPTAKRCTECQREHERLSRDGTSMPMP